MEWRQNGWRSAIEFWNTVRISRLSGDPDLTKVPRSVRPRFAHERRLLNEPGVTSVLYLFTQQRNTKSSCHEHSLLVSPDRSCARW